MARRIVINVPAGSNIDQLPEEEIERLVIDAAKTFGIDTGEPHEIVVEAASEKPDDEAQGIHGAVWLISWSRHGAI